MCNRCYLSRWKNKKSHQETLFSDFNRNTSPDPHHVNTINRQSSCTVFTLHGCSCGQQNEPDDQERSKLESGKKGHTKEIDTIIAGLLHLFIIDTTKECTAIPKDVNGQIMLSRNKTLLDQSCFSFSFPFGLCGCWNLWSERCG